jgi:Aerotolerance regulator N-terminal/von Willebrand factor type A domain
MNLLVPAFLAAAALLGLPLFLHLLRLQPRQHVAFPSLLFLGRDALRDSNRHRLRRWLTLLLRCLLISLIVLAFARPFWRFEHSDSSRAVVVVVDNSYSMQAQGRSVAVEAWLAPQIAALRAPDQLGVLLLHPTPTWLVPLTDDLEAGRVALKTLPQSYETSHYRAGLELAGAKLALSKLAQKQILLAADEQRLGWNGVRFERPLPPSVKLLAAPAAPAPKRQAAITALKVTRTDDGQISFDVSLRGYSAGNDERTVTFHSGDKVLGALRCVLTPGRTQTFHAGYAVPDITAALMLHATIDRDELTVDDIAYVALAGANDRRVILAPGRTGAEADYLGLALGAGGDGKPPAFRVDPLPGPRVAWPASTVAVLRGPAPFRGEAVAMLDAFLTAGGSAWIICDGSPEQAAWLAAHGVTVAPVKPVAGGKLKLRDLALEHPLFAPFLGHSIAPLLSPTFHRGWSLRADAAEPLARWLDRTVAIAEVPTGGGRLLVTGFGETRADSTFPVEAGYVPFVHQAISWLAQNQMAAPIGCRVGATLVLPGAGTWRAVLSPKLVAPAEVNGYVTPTVPGIYAFEQKDLPKRFYAVNVDPVESDLDPWPTPADFARLVAPEKKVEKPAAGPSVSKHIPWFRLEPVTDPSLVDERLAWWWLLAAAVAVLFLELALSNRTIP